MTAPRLDLPPVTVTLRCQQVDAGDPFAAFLAARGVYGPRSVFLLESLAGPSADTRSAAVGVLPLLTLALRGRSVLLDGVPSVRAAARAHLLAAGLAGSSDGEAVLLLPPQLSLWDLQRAIGALFDVPGLGPDAFGFGALTVYGYDAVRHIETLPDLIADPDPVGELVMTFYAATALFDLATAKALVTVATSPWWPDVDLTELGGLFATAATDVEPGNDRGHPKVPEPLRVNDSVTCQDFEDDVRRCLDHIAVGDIYQVQVGHELTVESTVDELDVYRRLRHRNPSPYMGVVPLGSTTMISASPELFLRLEGQVATMRPIAGTVARSRDAQEDSRRRESLRHNEKELAEHIMLVDLCRNDLGKVALADTLDVAELMAVEDYSHVFHLVSDVQATVAAEHDVYDVVRATFPAGTMTGTPKLRAMEIIEATETRRRGWYAGAFGLVGLGGFANLGLTIRTVFRTGQTYRTRASAGVVVDSTPHGEWLETLAKLSAAYWALTDRELA